MWSMKTSHFRCSLGRCEVKVGPCLESRHQEPFRGREGVRELLSDAMSLPKGLDFIIDDVAGGDSWSGDDAVGMTWHVEFDGVPLPNSRGASFYKTKNGSWARNHQRRHKETVWNMCFFTRNVEQQNQALAFFIVECVHVLLQKPMLLRKAVVCPWHCGITPEAAWCTLPQLILGVNLKVI